GQGTRFTLQLPISMSVIRALLVRIAGEPYAFPLNRIDRILSLPVSSIQPLEGREHFLLDGQPVGLVEARQVLVLPAPGRASDTPPVVVASDRSHRFGVVVDEFLGERDLEVRPLDPRLGKVPDLNSASVLDDGWPVLIIDVEDLVRSVDNLLSGRRLRKVTGHHAHHEGGGPRGGLSSTTRSPSASWSGSSWKATGTPWTWPSTGSTAGTRCGPAGTIWS